MARVYDRQRQTTTNIETGATTYYHTKVTGGPKHSKAFYEDMRARVGMGACSACKKPFAPHSDAEIDECFDKFVEAQKKK